MKRDEGMRMREKQWNAPFLDAASNDAASLLSMRIANDWDVFTTPDSTIMRVWVTKIEEDWWR